MAWMIREDQLDPDQREFINVESQRVGNIWVKGFAGSGKSVLLIHSLKNIIQQEPNAKVAVVVYTHSLIDMFKTGMKELNIPSNIPLMTYYEFVDKNKDKFDYIFCDEVQDLPKKVLFDMKNRAKKIVVAGDSHQSIYQRDPKWSDEVVDSTAIGDIIDARAFSLNIVHRLTRSIISAVQKILPGMNIWGAQRDMTKVDVNIRLCEAQNENEEIKYVYNESIKGPAVNESSVILIPNHDDIISFVNKVLNVNNKPAWELQEKFAFYVSIDSVNEQKAKNISNKKIVKKKGSKLYLGYFFNESSCKNELQRLVSNGISSELIKESWGFDYDSMNNYLRSQNIKLQFVGSNYGSLLDAERNKEAILMTYHSSKGLDFDNVFLPFLNAHFYLHPNNAETLFMVAMTRSRKNLYLTYFGYTHDLVDKFKSECTEISISDILNQRTTNRSTNNFDY
jgi:hypothetical protein